MSPHGRKFYHKENASHEKAFQFKFFDPEEKAMF